MIEQPIDHFNWGPPIVNQSTTFNQRYFYTDKYWSTNKTTGARGPIFFYFGNEDNVELYVNHTGLMWENAQQFGAKLVFAEHRYYGTSVPFKPDTPGCMNWLTTEQAMADFAFLIDSLHQLPGAVDSAVIGFGGSYGGMVGSWFRMHYPMSVDGVIAASAPIWSFHGLEPEYDYNGFDLGVTQTVRGAIANCAPNLEDAWNRIIKAAGNPQGLADINNAFLPCSPIKTKQDALDLVNWLANPWGYYAMGNYPYPSSYMLHGDALLPGNPISTACGPMLEYPISKDADLFVRVKIAVNYFYNATKDPSKTCNPVEMFGDDDDAREANKLKRKPRGPLKKESSGANSCTGSWGYQWCTEMVQPFVQGTPDDMFYCSDGTDFPKENCSDTQRFDFDSAAAGCKSSWGVTPNKDWAKVMLANKKLNGVSNIVFSNGLMDPWHLGGVLANVSDSVVAIQIPNGAHHIDLMFSDVHDTADIQHARDMEVTLIKQWIDEVANRTQVQETDN